MNSTSFKPCILIPVYNHGQAIERVVQSINQYSLPCILVDDGSHEECQRILTHIQKNYESVFLITHNKNKGKGAAVITGMFFADEKKFTHVLQIDADGQHNTNDIPIFLEKAKKSPNAVIAGYPIYDQSVPRARLYGRYVTHFWVWINTLSLQIKDSMCGFRLYPLQNTIDLIRKQSLGQRMTFDTDILVKLYWEGIEIINVPTKVTYPLDGVSHFKHFRDNFQISCMHAKHFFGMLIRIPQLLRFNRRQS